MIPEILSKWPVLLVLFLMASWGSAQHHVPGDDLHVDPARLEEWNDWRFGLFIHWGPWSQREVGYIWKMVNEESEEVGSRSFELWKTFNPTAFDPSRWARAAKDAGMKYVVFVVKHHDGLNNYDTRLSDFKTTNPIVPYSRDPNADLTKAVVDAFRAEGLRIGLYYSHIDWHHPDGKHYSRDHWHYDPSRLETDPDSWHRFAEFQKGQIRELLTNYGEIDIMWFDISWPGGATGNVPNTIAVVKKDILAMIAMMKELQPGIIFNDRGTDIYGGFYTPEQQVPAAGLPGYWESNITITNERGYWYKGDQVSAKSPEQLTRMLIEIAAKGGNFLMNVGPRPDGELSATEYEALAGIGAWMKLNGESIYATDKSRFLDLPWGWSTTKLGKLYLHVFDWPADGQLLVPGLRSTVQKAFLLEDPQRRALEISPANDGQVIRVGRFAPNDIASVVVVELDGEPDIYNTYRQQGDGPIELSAAFAKVISETARYNFGTATRRGNYIQDIENADDRIVWDFKLNTPGEYEVSINYACQHPQAGSDFALSIDGLASFRGTVRGTADWQGDLLNVQRQAFDRHERHNNLWTFRDHVLGTVMIDERDNFTLTVSPSEIAQDYLAFVKSVRLQPTGP